MYADDATQYHYQSGKVIWAEPNSENTDAVEAANRLIDVLGINDKAWQHIYALCAYGDVFIRLYRSGDQSDYNDKLADVQGKTTLRIKPKDRTRKIEEYIEYVDDPAAMYDLQVRDKTAGYIKMISTAVEDSPLIYKAATSRTMDLQDVNLYDNTSFVHICLPGNIERHPELITLTDSSTGKTNVYKVKTGKSILADAYEAAQTVKLLEDSMLLNRVTKSALVRILQVEVGSMPKPEQESLLRRVKNLIEQKVALDKGNGVVTSYNSPGPMENVIYVPTHGGIGAITSSNLGGDVNIKDIVDVDYFNNKKLSALKIPKQYLNYDAPEGLGNGTSLTKLSSRYAHTIMRIQKAYITAITNLLNIIFLDKGMDYIGKFVLKMVSPATIEDVERDEQLQNRLNQASDIIGMVEGKIDDEHMLEVVDWLIGTYLNLPDVQDILQKSNAQHDDSPGYHAGEGGHDFGGGGMGGGSFDGPDVDFGFDSAEPTMDADMGSTEAGASEPEGLEI